MGTGASTYDKESFGFKDEIADAVTASFPGLDGKVVAVTGCSTGLGLEVAKVRMRQSLMDGGAEECAHDPHAQPQVPALHCRRGRGEGGG
mmetsp:Transcript_22742/g.70411  ORF Transcript_22742/g.70411 Transcript_22742/m.70411 type:complete len:90 (+) Transcript_22742:175-444(+)